MNYCPNCQIGIDYRQMKDKHCNNCGHDWEVFHVLPVNDIKEHRESYVCHCLPEVKHESGNTVLPAVSIDEAAVIMQTLMSYGNIRPIEGVVYPEGTHKEMLRKADEWLWRYRSARNGI